LAKIFRRGFVFILKHAAHGIDQIRDDNSQFLVRDDSSIGGFSRRGYNVSKAGILQAVRRSNRLLFEQPFQSRRG
jgi:hypothetical protein